MPLYQFHCDNCNNDSEIRMSFALHEETRNKVPCEKCGQVMIQSISRLNFKLGGVGWSETNYGITNLETSSNLESEKRIEERYNTALSKGEA